MKDEIVTIIKNKLKEIEKEHNVSILYAVESGSRAWGFESQDSDYDVRFIYAHNKDWYLNILPKQDVIEYPIVDDFDYSGWDLRKTLFLMHKSNPVFFEWMRSSIVYYKDDYVFNILEQLHQGYFSQMSSIYHYLHMASNNFKQYLLGDEVKIKKYFYVLRPVLACIWIESYKETPPMEFETLLSQIQDKELLRIINELLAKKRSGIELGLEPQILEINKFLEEKLNYFKCTMITSKFNPKHKPAQELLEDGFIKILNHVESNRFLYLKPTTLLQ
jgi:predicted nucleotidyltransferase